MVTSLHSGRCLDVTGVSASTGQPIPNTDNSAALQQWECNPFTSQPNQTFLLEAASGGYRLRAAHSQRCVDVSDVSVNNGAAIQQWDCAPWYQPNQVFVLEAAAPPNFPSYFGYTGSAVQGFFANNSTAQLADHSNLAWVGGPSGSFAPRLAEAASLGMYAMVDVGQLFFNGSQGAIVPKSDPEILSNWNALVSEISPYINNVVAFYPLDEPYSHNVSGQGWSQAAMKAKLTEIASMIHATYPTKAVAVIFQAVFSHFDIPAGFNWVAFDCYRSWDNCQGYPIRTWHNALKAQLSPGQKMFLVPDSYGEGSSPSLAFEQDVVGRANHFADLAYSEQDVVAIIPFYWNDYRLGQPGCTAQACFATIRAGFVDIGKAITGR